MSRESKETLESLKPLIAFFIYSVFLLTVMVASIKYAERDMDHVPGGNVERNSDLLSLEETDSD